MAEYKPIISDAVILEPEVKGACCVYNKCDLSNCRKSLIKNNGGVMAPLEHIPALSTWWLKMYFTFVFWGICKRYNDLSYYLMESLKIQKTDMCTLTRQCKRLSLIIESRRRASAVDGCRVDVLLSLNCVCRGGCRVCRWQLHWFARLWALHVTSTHFPLTWHLCVWDVCVTHWSMSAQPRCLFLSADIPQFPPPESGRKLHLIERG